MTNRSKSKKKETPLTPSVQHCKNADTMALCAECDKWRLVCLKKKLTERQRRQLTSRVYLWISVWFVYLNLFVYIANIFVFLCVSFPDDVKLLFKFQAYVKDHDGNGHIKKLYYSCEYETCCIHCGEYVHGIEDDVPSTHSTENARRIQFQKGEHSNLRFSDLYCHSDKHTAYHFNIRVSVSLAVNTGCTYVVMLINLY